MADHCICCGGKHLAAAPAVLMPFISKRVFDYDLITIDDGFGLNDLHPGAAYMLCKSIQCQDCSVIFLNIRFSDEQMHSLYSGYRDEQYVQQRLSFEPSYSGVINHFSTRESYISDVEKWLKSYLPENPAVLDWGGGSGINTVFLGKSSKIEVLDPSDAPLVEGALRADLDKQCSNPYDLIACCQVLEHVPYPTYVLKQIREVMKPATLLYVEVPLENFMFDHKDDSQAYLFKKHWHEHINFFSEKSMISLICASGFSIIDSTVISIDVGWKKSRVMGFLLQLFNENASGHPS